MRVALARAPEPRTFLAFDFGTRRVGVAGGNTLTGGATPLATIGVEGDARWTAIAALVAEWRPDALVVGVPFHPDGAAHANTARARSFGRELAARFGLVVHEVDERYSTVEAARAPTPTSSRNPEPSASGYHVPKRGNGIDAAAAAVILEQFLAGPGS